jgi:fimbrial chaperone protein
LSSNAADRCKLLRAFLTGCALGFCSLASAADEGGLQLSPIRLDLGIKARGGALTLTNTTRERKTVQVDVNAWTQRGGEEIYEPTQALLVNPPLFFLEPGASQVVRVGLPAATREAPPAEQAYRVFMREVPDERPLDVPGLRVVVRLGVPVFVAPRAAGAAQLNWSGVVNPDGSVTVISENTGAIHARAADLRLLPQGGGEELARDATMHYVLVGSRKSWHFKPKHALSAGPVKITALMEEGVREFPVVLRKP